MRALRAISKSAASSLLLDAVPQELLFGERVDLHRWTLIVNDETLDELSKQQSSSRRYYLNSCADNLHGIFATFWTATSCPRGLLLLNISGAKDITDYGLTLIARASAELTTLSIAGCTQITDVGLREIALGCRKLQDLDVSSCHGVEGHGLSAVAECCPNLMKVNLSRCRGLQNWSLQKLFRGCKRLEEVIVSHLKHICDDDVRVLAEHCADLFHFEAIECLCLTDQCVLSLTQYCRDLDFLDLSRSEMTYRVSDVSLMALGQRATSLRSLKLNHCDQLTDVGLGWLTEGCKLVELLDFNGCNKFTDAGMRMLGSSCHALTSLDISHAKAVSDVGISSLAKGCPALKTLKCHGLFLLTDPSLAAASTSTGKHLEPWEEVIGLAALAGLCPNLEVVDASGCFRLNRVLQSYFPKLTQLKSLNLKGCNHCSSNALMTLAAGMHLLETLVLSDCGKAVNNKVLQAFAQHCPLITILEICRCDEVKEGAIKAASSMSKLNRLDLAGCKSLTDSMLVHLTHVERLLELRYLDLTNCPRVGDSFLAWMSMKHHKLLHLCMQGSAVTRKALMSVRDRFPNCDMLINDNYFGFWPKHRVTDRMLLNKYYQMIEGVTRVQARVRKVKAIRRVQNIQEERRRICAQLLIQRVGRGYVARIRVHKVRNLRRRLAHAAMHIAALFRRVVARRKLGRKRDEKHMKYLNASALRIQCCYRAHRDKCVLFNLRLGAVRRHQRRVAATLVVQSFARMMIGKSKAKRVKALKNNRERVINRKALIIQRSFRGHVARQTTKKYKALLAEMLRRKLLAVVAIQHAFRVFRTNKIVFKRQEKKNFRLIAVISIQAVMRGALARLHVMEIRMEQWTLIKKKAVLAIQCRWRVFKARCEFFQRIKERMGARLALMNAANTIIRQVRVKLAYMTFKIKHAEYIARLTAQALREIEAATTIQAMVRSHQGRKRYYIKLAEKKGQWKELFDEEKGKRFFYNKLTGEVRWRIPKDLLDLVPHPICDDCCEIEAVLECSVCNELFCGPCFNQIHRGGRRASHDYRALYDYYGKRLDYGDGEFPCQWPSEVIQDEIQGWMLRINPHRKPVEVYDCGWEKYADVDPGKRTLKNIEEWRVKDSMGKEAAERVFYFNRNTFQSTYDVPQEVASEVAAKSAVAVRDYNYYSTGYFNPRTNPVTPGTADTYADANRLATADSTEQQSVEYDPSDPWYQGYYDEAGNWVYYNYSAEADNSMALVVADQGDQSMPFTSEEEYEYQGYST